MTVELPSSTALLFANERQINRQSERKKARCFLSRNQHSDSLRYRACDQAITTKVPRAILGILAATSNSLAISRDLIR